MKTIAIIGFALFIGSGVYSQTTPSETREISVEDLKMKTCSFEPDASAMKLIDIQAVEFEPSPFGGKIITEKKVRIKIFNEKGYKDASITIPYFSNKKNTKIEEIKAAVYSLDASGNISKEELKEEDFYNEKEMNKIGVIRFTYPNLKPGNIVEYSYKMSEKNRIVIDNWIIQSEIPSAYSAISVTIPSFSALKDFTFGMDSISRNVEKLTKGLDRVKHSFYKSNIPSFTPEPLMTSINDNMLRMGFVLIEDDNVLARDFSSQSMWRLAANQLLKSNFYNDQVRKNIPGTEKIIDTAMTYANKQDRLRYIYSVLKQRIPAISGQSVATDDISDAWKKRSGNSAEINFLLHNLLTRAKITNYLVLVSTRDHGMVNKDFPSYGQFNQMDILVDIDGNKYLIDASLKYQSYSTPPINVLNREVFILNPDNIDWAMVTDDRPLLKHHTDIFGSLTNTGRLEGGASINYYDYAKSLALDSSLVNDSQSNDRFFEKKTPGLKLLKTEKTLDRDEDPFLETIEFDYDLQNQGDFYFIKPSFFTSSKINPFSKQSRNYDIDFGCNQEIRLSMQLDLPQNFKVEELPKNITVKSPDESLVFTRIISVHQAKISYSHKLEIRKAQFDKSEYPALMDFFKQAQKLLAEEIILKKNI